MTKKEILERFSDIGVVHKESTKLRSGTLADFYCDIKKAYGYPDILNALAGEVGKMLPDNVTAIAGSGYGGLPLAALVAAKFNKKFIAVRDKEKSHGKGGLIGGYIPTEKDVVVIVDDVLTTGSSVKETYGILKETRINIESVIVVVKRGDAELPIPYTYMFTVDEIVKQRIP